MADAVRAALLEALDLEYRAQARAEAAIAAFGPVRPFVGLAEAERRHVDSLIRAFERLGLDLPPNTWRGRLCPPTNLRDVCQAAVKEETEALARYDRLLAKVTDPDLRTLLEGLRDDTRSQHLPAVTRCAEDAEPAEPADPT